MRIIKQTKLLLVKRELSSAPSILTRQYTFASDNVYGSGELVDKRACVCFCIILLLLLLFLLLLFVV